jgi:hypothetical protein
LKSHFDSPSKKKIILLVFSFILCVKLHYLFLLLFPTLLFGIVSLTHPEKTKAVLKWKVISRFLLIPIVLIGIALYFFVFKDYNDPRFLSPEVDLYDRLFLPLFSPEAPLDRYNLFSLNHISDFLNVTFLWSAAGVFVLVVVSLFYRKGVNWDQPIILSTGFLLLLFSMVFFAFNPLLSMPMDFDLFSLAAPFLLFFAFFILEELQTESLAKSIAGPLIGISILSIAIFLCNHQKDSLSLRMESVGKHIFKTYWIRSAGDIQLGLNLVNDQPEEYITRSMAIVNELEPFALMGNDLEYATLLWSVGKKYRKQNDYSNSLNFHLKSLNYSTNVPANYIGLTESNYLLENYTKAYLYSLKLIEFNYPNHKKALEIAIDCSLMAGLDSDAEELIENYLQKWDHANYRIILENLSKKQSEQVAKSIQNK